MSEPRIYDVTTRLVQQAARPGGRSLGELISAAERGLERARGDMESAVEGGIVGLERLIAEGAAETATLYAAASRIVDVTGFYGAGPLHAAARSLCDLCDHAGPADWPSVGVHVRALRLLRQEVLPEAAATALLDGLRKVVDAAPARR